MGEWYMTGHFKALLCVALTRCDDHIMCSATIFGVKALH